MSQPPPRGIIMQIFKNIRARYAYKDSKPKMVGTDYMDNTYWEVIRTTKDGVKTPTRYYFPTNEDDWDRPLQPEWEAWLRYRRDELPTVEEIGGSIRVALLKKKRAAELAAAEEQQLLTGGSKDWQCTAVLAKPLVNEAGQPLGRMDTAAEPHSIYNKFPRYKEYDRLLQSARKKDPFYDHQDLEVVI